VPRAVLWTSLLRAVTRGSAVVTTIVLARLISPEQYGIFATILIANQALAAATDVSVDFALVQMRDDPRPYLSTAWTVGVVRGALLFVVIFAGAPAFCDLFHVPDAVPLLRALALVQVIIGFHNIGVITLRRDLVFDRIFALQVTEVITYSVVVIAVAAVTHDAWALVVAVVASFAARVVASYVVTPIRGGFGFDYGQFVRMFTFSKWTNAYVFIDFVLETADNTVVARVVGATSLAFYRMGYQLATEGTSAVQWVVNAVAFPAFARIQLDREHVRRSYRALLGAVTAVVVPLAIGLAMLGGIGVPLILGERWAPAAAPLAVLAIAALIRALLESARPLLLGLGHSRGDFGLKLVQVTLLVLLVVPAGLAFGVQGVAWAVLAAAAGSLPAWLIVLLRTARLSIGDVVQPIIAPFVAGAGGALVLALLPAPEVAWTDLATRGAALAIAYGGITFLLLRLLPGSGVAVARAALR
jgi:lipopolysaccharide exporter